MSAYRRLKLLVLSDVKQFEIPAWPVAALVSLSKTLNGIIASSCRMGRKAVKAP